MDIIINNLSKIKIVKIHVKLRVSKVSDTNKRTGFWPKVELEIPYDPSFPASWKHRCIPMTWYADIENTKASSGLYVRRSLDKKTDKLEIAVLNFAGGTANTNLRMHGRDLALFHACKRVRAAIQRAISKAAYKGKTAKRHISAERKKRREVFLEKFRSFCGREGLNVQYEDVRPQDLGKVWDDVRRLKVADLVMSS